MFHRIVVGGDGALLAQNVEITAGDLRIHAAVFVQNFNQRRVGAVGFLLVHFELIDDHLDALDAVGAQPADGFHHRGHRAADGFAIGLDFV